MSDVQPPRPVSPDHYRSVEFMRLEWERLWPRVWMFAGPSADVAEPGDFVTINLGPEPLLITRDDAGVLSGFYNVCQHRGRKLCDVHRGRVQGLRCPFHGWTYNLDGSLRSMPDAEQFPQAWEELALEPISVAEVKGFLWVCLGQDPEPIEDFLGPEVLDWLEGFRPGPQWSLGNEFSLCVHANWKCGVDIMIEWLHIHVLHPHLLQTIDDTDIQATALGPRHWYVRAPMPLPSKRLGPDAPPHPLLEEELRRAGLAESDWTGTAEEVRAALVRLRRATGAAEGYDDTGLNDDKLTDNNELVLFPNTQMMFFAREMVVFRHRPHATDPLRSWFDFQVYVRLPEGAPPLPRPTPAILDVDRELEQIPTQSVREDIQTLDILHEGMRSRGFRGANMGHSEAVARSIHDTVDRYVATPPGEPVEFAD